MLTFLFAVTALRACAAESLDDSALLQVVHNASKVGSCGPCEGKMCCCQSGCGLVSGLREKYRLLAPGSYNVEESFDLIRGFHVETNSEYSNQCAAYLRSFFAPNALVSTVKTNLPCALYVGSLGLQWSRAGANSLEGSSKIQKIVGSQCRECPMVPVDDTGAPFCGTNPFPTLFWETASFMWAQTIATISGCRGNEGRNQVFILVPGLEPSEEALSKKISFRIELQGLAGNNPHPLVYFASDESCSTLHAALCREKDIRASISLLKGSTFCIGEIDEGKVKRLKYLSRNAAAFDCSSSIF